MEPKTKVVRITHSYLRQKSVCKHQAEQGGWWAAILSGRGWESRITLTYITVRVCLL